MKKITKKNYIALAVGCTLLICTLAVFLLVMHAFHKKPEPDVSFSSERWKTCPYTERHQMLRLLEREYALIGMKKDEIKSLLGEADFAHDSYINEKNGAQNYLGYRIEKDEYSGIRVLLIGFRDEAAVGYEVCNLSDL